MTRRCWKFVLAAAIGAATLARPAAAQVAPADLYPPPDDTPNVRVGGTLFADYTYHFTPEIADIDGTLIHPNALNVTRAYLNVTGQVNHLILFRVTPDIARETGTGSALAGSMVLRLKYGYAQINLDDWMWRGSYARIGMIQTPYIDFEDSIYRYRFQGPTFTDREAYLASADVGASFRTQFPGGYGEVVTGVYNGEGYNRVDPNDQKAFQIRGTVRPLPAPGPLRGLRATVFYDADHYVQNAARERLVTLLTYEHRFLNAGWVHMNARDQTSTAAPVVDGSGHSFWVTPRILLSLPKTAPPTGNVRASVEGLIRYDRLEPNHDNDSAKERFIVGVAYWPRMIATNVGSAFLVDYEQVRYHAFTGDRPNEQRVAMHMVLTF